MPSIHNVKEKDMRLKNHTTIDTGWLRAMVSPIRNQHNFVPQTVRPRRIGIIGGRGAMGQLLAREFAADGYDVLVTGENIEGQIVGRTLAALNRKLVRSCDVIVLAVPVHVMNGGLPEILRGGYWRGLRSKLILDITSTKSVAMEKLSHVVGASVIGTHPMFGPSVTQFGGLHVFVSPLRRGHRILDARLDKWVAWIEAFWKKRGVRVHHVAPAEHDQLVTCLQFAVLAATMLFAEVIRDSGIDIRRLREVYTPN